MRLIMGFIGLALLMLATFFMWGESWEQQWTLGRGIAWLEGWGSWAWLAGIALLLADLVLPVPGTVVMSALGFIYGPWIGGLIAASGSFMAGMTGYAACRCMGERAALWLLGAKDFGRGQELFQRFGGLAVATSRALPIFPEIIACMAGLVRMPLKVFMLALGIGCLPMGMAFAWIGHEGRQDPGFALVLSLVIPGVLWLGAWLWLRKKQRGSGKN
jgi:uncharacterized membrane protein YdjX (TVP38/TMEM64 family)